MAIVNYSMKDKQVSSIEEAIELIEEAKKEKANREINTFDHDGDELRVLNGRYGPYISFKKKNYKIPKDTAPEKLTLEECMAI